jgi:enoyl-CoA hydratase
VLGKRVSPRGNLGRKTRKRAPGVESKSPLALQLAKSACYTAEDMEYETQFAVMNEAFTRLWTSKDAQEGVLAFFEKREPHWEGQ